MRVAFLRRSARWLLPVLLLAPVPAAGAAGAAVQAPRLELDAERRLVLTGLPPILDRDGVKEHLTTGLTTSVYLRPGKAPGGARVDVRYDLWDEVFHVAAAGHGDRIERARLPSFAGLVEWWQGLRLVLVDGARLERPWPRRLEVRADVVPFSAAEQDDARRWFSESIDEARQSGAGEVGSSGEGAGEGLSRTFDLLLATSIRRRALATFRWSVTLPPEASGGAP